MTSHFDHLFSRRNRKERRGVANGRRALLSAAIEALEARRLLTTITAVTSSTSYQDEATDVVFTPVGASSPTVVAAYNDYGLPVHQKTGWSLSTNGGSSFAQQTSSTVPLTTSEQAAPHNNYGTGGDPVLAHDNVSGASYLATLADSRRQIDVFTAAYNGSSVSFAPPVAIAGDLIDSVDKPWITVDNWQGTGQGTVYVAFNFTRSGSSQLDPSWTTGIYLFKSSDGGASWSCLSVDPTYGTPTNGTPQPIISAATTTSYDSPEPPGTPPDHTVTHDPFGVQVVVGKDHQPFLVWWDRGTDTPLSAPAVNFEKLMWSHELSSGYWSAHSVVAPEVYKPVGQQLLLHGDWNTAGPKDANSLPQAAINPVTGAVYVAWSDGTGQNDPSAGDRADVNFSSLAYASFGGYNSSAWTDAVSLDGNDANDQWHPAIAVSSNGAYVFVGYYSRQDDASDVLIKPYATIGSVASSGSITWATPQSLSGLSSFRQPVNELGSMGDYNTASADYSIFYYSFCQSDADGNGTNPQIKMAIVPIPYVSPPAAPSTFTATPAIVSGSNVFNLVWSGTYSSSLVADVQYAAAGTAQWVEYGTTAASDNAMQLSGLSATSSYYFRLRIHDANDTTSSTFVYASCQLPAMPQDFHSSWGGASGEPFTLSWTGVWTSGIVVHLQYLSGSTWTDYSTSSPVPASGLSMSFSLPVMNYDGSYSFRIRAENAFMHSAWASADMHRNTSEGGPSVTGIDYDSTNNRVIVTWDGSGYDVTDHIHLLYSTYAALGGTHWHDMAGNTTTASEGSGVIAGLSPDSTTNVRLVVEHPDSGWSEPSSAVAVAPIVISVVNDGNGEFEITWNGTVYASGEPMAMQYKEDNAGSWSPGEDPLQYLTTNANGGWGAISGLDSSHGYYFRLTTTQGTNSPIWSETVFAGGV